MKLTLFISLLLCCLTLSGQQLIRVKADRANNPRSLFEESEVDNLYSLYSGKTDITSELINGREFFPYYIHSNSNPMLFYGKKYSCSIFVNGNKYKDVFLEYDTYKDKVIYIDTSQQFKTAPVFLVCNTSRVGAFELYQGGDTLIFFFFDSENYPGFNLSNGYYEVAYSGISKYLIRHISYVIEIKAINEYNYNLEKYIDVGNGFKKFKTRKQFIKIFGGKSGYIKEYISKNGINIRNAGKSEIVSILKYYDSITE